MKIADWIYKNYARIVAFCGIALLITLMTYEVFF